MISLPFHAILCKVILTYFMYYYSEWFTEFLIPVIEFLISKICLILFQICCRVVLEYSKFKYVFISLNIISMIVL